MKTFIFAVFAAMALPAHAVSVSVDYSHHAARAEGEHVGMSGIGIGVSADPKSRGAYGRLELLKGEDNLEQVVEADVGYQHPFVAKDKFYLLGKIGAGIARAEVKNGDSPTFITVPLGIEAGYTPTEKFGIYVGAGYKWAWDTTAPTTCRDGTSSNSTGRGSCSWHGGVAQYNNSYGNVHGITATAGLRYSF